ncbi:MAG: transmembrane permease [Owenweeksia sp.]|nr:transmembrane permease [Owenweeksia sp.]
MNFEFFIANRILKSNTATRKISRPVIRISIWAIALGMIIMILAMATGTGLRKEIRNKVIGFGGHIQIINYQPNPTLEQTPVSLDDSLYRQLRNLKEVSHIQAFGKKAGILKQGDLFEGTVLKDVDSSFNWSLFNSYLKQGHRLHGLDAQRNDSILISTALAKKLQIALNDKVSIYFVREAPKPPLLRYFYVAGLYQTDFEEIDNTVVVGDLRHIQRLNKWDSTQTGGYEIFVEDEEKADELASSLRTLLPFELDALTSRQLNEQLFQWLDLFDINIAIILIIMIIVAIINISIALLILILERTQLIGILKALGSPNVSIRKIFLWNAFYLILRGLFWGNLIGVGACLLQQQFGLVKLDPATYYVSEVSVNLDWIGLLLLNGGTVLVCLACLVLPSYLITRISPVKAIRFD